MNKTAKIVLSIFVVILAAGAAFALASSSKTDETSSTEPATNSQSSEDANTATNGETINGDNAEAAATIRYTGFEFVPTTVTIKAGQTIEIINDSSKAVQFDSDPHPEHTDNEELNADFIGPRDSKKITITKKGVWGFHNHLDPEVTGKVNVE